MLREVLRSCFGLTRAPLGTEREVASLCHQHFALETRAGCVSLGVVSDFWHGLQGATLCHMTLLL